MMQEISNREIVNAKSLGLAIHNMYFETNFSLLVMKVTEINFLY